MSASDKDSLLIGGIIFGIVFAICIIGGIPLIAKIEDMRDEAENWIWLALFIAEWAIIIGVFLLLKLIWNKLIDPYK